MSQYTSQTQKDPSGPAIKHVEILNSEGKWERKKLIGEFYWVGGRGNVFTWLVEGTLNGYEDDQINSLRSAGKLRDVKPTPENRRSSLNEVRAKRRNYSKKANYDPSVGPDLTSHRREVLEQSGAAADIRRELAGLNDYKITFEDEGGRHHKQKLIFFRGAGAFQGSLPFYFDNRALANRKASAIVAMMGVNNARGVVGNPKNEKHKRPFQGSLRVRCKHSFEARKIADQIAGLIGFTGKTHLHHFGHAAACEIRLATGVRDTKRRVQREERIYSRAS
ncbi:MAG: hypothetical protein AAF564_17850 [Bacteroidota bacterium]